MQRGRSRGGATHEMWSLERCDISPRTPGDDSSAWRHSRLVQSAPQKRSGHTKKIRSRVTDVTAGVHDKIQRTMSVCNPGLSFNEEHDCQPSLPASEVNIA